MSERVNRLWYQRRLNLLLWPLIPLTMLFVLAAALRRLAFRIGLKKVYKPDVPTLVVGNISVGGTGKTPLTIALVDALKQAGFKPVIVSRGYGGKGPFPQVVTASSDAYQVGDEPLMLATVTGVPVVVSPSRVQAAKLAVEDCAATVIVADDGLQHYALGRHIEIAVVDASRGFGNGWRMPCGPLRESRRRLKKVDYVAVNGAMDEASASQALDAVAGSVARLVPMHLAAHSWRRVSDHREIETPDGESVVAVAGIGNPQRFFSILGTQGLEVMESRVFADHHQYAASDFYTISNLYPVVMTEKDAVKCQSFARPHWYYLKVGAVLPEAMLNDVIQRVQELSDDT